MDASIFDSAPSHTRRSDASEKGEEIACPLLDVFAFDQVSSPRLCRLKNQISNFSSDLLKPYNRYAHPYDVAKRTQLYYDQDCKHTGKKLVKNGEIIVTVVSVKIIASLNSSKIYYFFRKFEFILYSTRAKTKKVPNVQKALIYMTNFLILEM